MEWTKTDIYTLREWLRRGKSLDDIGKELHRSARSVYEKARTLGIKLVERKQYPCVVADKLSVDIRREVELAKLEWDTAPPFKPHNW